MELDNVQIVIETSGDFAVIVLGTVIVTLAVTWLWFKLFG